MNSVRGISWLKARLKLLKFRSPQLSFSPQVPNKKIEGEFIFMKISKEIYETVKKVALGYTEYEIREYYLPAGQAEVLGGKVEALPGGAEEKVEKGKRAKLKKDAFIEKTYVVESLDGLSLESGAGEMLVCVKREVVAKVHGPDVQAIKMLVDIEKDMAKKESFDGFADDLLILTKKQLVELREELLKRDLSKLL